MAITTAVTASAGASWQKKETDPLNSSTFFDDQGNFQYAKNFTDGSGLESVNSFFHDRIGLAAGADTTIDMQSLSTTLFGTSITTTLTGVKQLYLENTSTGNGQNLHLLATGTNANLTIMNGSGNFVVYPKSAINFTNFVSGWIVTNITKNLIVRNAGAIATTGNFFLAGTSG